MWPSKPKAQLTTVEQQISAIKMAELEMRIAGLEQAIIELCYAIKDHVERIDHNTRALDEKINQLYAMTISAPKNMLGENKEPN
jgi:uncharacterized coiled-coil protein SlyX